MRRPGWTAPARCVRVRFDHATALATPSWASSQCWDHFLISAVLLNLSTGGVPARIRSTLSITIYNQAFDLQLQYASAIASVGPLSTVVGKVLYIVVQRRVTRGTAGWKG